MFGWDGDSLQKAMDNGCNLNNACPKAGLTTQQPAQYNACKKKQQAPEQVDGCKFCLLFMSELLALFISVLLLGMLHQLTIESGLKSLPLGDMPMRA